MGEEGADMGSMGNIEVENSSFECPSFSGSEGERSLDISSLRSRSGYVTLDPAFVNTAACTSSITFLDGEKGVLRYRGYPIEQLAEKLSFSEVSLLLMEGEIPSSQEVRDFQQQMHISEDVKQLIKNLVITNSKNTHPMALLSAAFVLISSVDEQTIKSRSLNDRRSRSELVAQGLGVAQRLAAEHYCHQMGRECGDLTENESSYCGGLLSLMFGQKATEEIARILEVLFILHADHEQNCSTSTVRVVGSSRVNPFAALSAGVNALWGPLHGGANQAVIEMLEAIAQDGGDYKKYLDKAKDKQDSFRLMGFGHRVYKNFDPRAKIIKKACDTVLTQLETNGELFTVAKGLEAEALQDKYFVERKLYPNVDFYSGIIYKALGIPTNMFTLMFALARLPGWLAQWTEMMMDPRTKIARPRQIYTGSTLRNVP